MRYSASRSRDGHIQGIVLSCPTFSFLVLFSYGFLVLNALSFHFVFFSS